MATVEEKYAESVSAFMESKELTAAGQCDAAGAAIDRALRARTAGSEMQRAAGASSAAGTWVPYPLSIAEVEEIVGARTALCKASGSESWNRRVWAARLAGVAILGGSLAAAVWGKGGVRRAGATVFGAYGGGLVGGLVMPGSGNVPGGFDTGLYPGLLAGGVGGWFVGGRLGR